MEFGSLFEFIRNGMSVKQDKSGDGLPISRIETIADATVNPEKVGFAGLKLEDCKNWLLRPGDILFSHINSVDHVGKCAVYLGLPEQLVHGMNLLCFRCDPTVAVPEFVKYLIRGPVFRANLSNFINKAVNQASVSIGNLKTISVRIPSISEQRRIAAILDQADALRAKRREALAQLDSLAQSIFIEMFGDPSLYPETSLGGVCELITDGTHQTPTYSDTGTIFLSAKNVTSGYIDWENIKYIPQSLHLELHRRLAPKVGDILLAKNGTTGVAAIVDRDCIFDVYVSLALLRPKHDVLPSYLLGAINSPICKKQFNESLKGIGVPNLHLKEIRATKIPMPPMQVQEKFAKRMAAVEIQKNVCRTALIEHDALFASLQHRAFQGEL